MDERLERLHKERAEAEADFASAPACMKYARRLDSIDRKLREVRATVEKEESR